MAPGDSTVVELTFETKTYKTKINRSATIYSNDPDKPQVKIFVYSHVDAAPDTTLPVAYSPMKLEFTKDKRKQSLTLENRSEIRLNLEALSMVDDGFRMKIENKEIRPGQTGKVEFEWKGDFEKENLESSITYLVTGRDSSLISIPLFVAGTDPTPPKEHKKKTPPAAKPSITSTSGAPVELTPVDIDPTAIQAAYACPMHAEIKSKTPGTCSKCGMGLKKVPPASGHNHNGTGKPPASPPQGNKEHIHGKDGPDSDSQHGESGHEHDEAGKKGEGERQPIKKHIHGKGAKDH